MLSIQDIRAKAVDQSLGRVTNTKIMKESTPKLLIRYKQHKKQSKELAQSPVRVARAMLRD